MTQNWHGEVVSISGLIDRARLALDAEVGRIAVEAEVFEYRGPHSSGHYYFKLRDEESSIDVKMWRGVASRGLTCRLQEGRSVLAIGRLDIWAKRGTLSFLLDEVHDLGAGDLARRFEELKNRLRLEGLFEEGRKQPIPLRPRKVCVITASPSAAEADMLLLVNTYHHITERPAYFAKLASALKPGGNLAVVDYTPGDSPHGPPAAMRIAPETVQAELEGSGWSMSEHLDLLPEQYVLVFTVAPVPAEPSVAE